MANPTQRSLEVASVHAACLADALRDALASSGRDTVGTPGEVVGLIDETLRQLHQIRERAAGESRRRLDAAMERSAALLDELRKRRGPVAVMRTAARIGPEHGGAWIYFLRPPGDHLPQRPGTPRYVGP